MFEKLKGLLKDNPDALSEINKISTTFNQLKLEVETNEKKLQDAISSRDKYKGFTKSAKEKLGFEDGEELSTETINDKINKLTSKSSKTNDEKNEILKKEIDALQNQLILNENEKADLINRSKSEVSQIQINFELAKVSGKINSIDPEANEIIIEKLKEGATFEDGKIIFKDKDGMVIRKNGVPMTVEDKKEEIEDKFHFLIKSDVKSGSGTSFGHGSNTVDGDISDWAKEKMKKLK